jgi:rod shape determining protein RodA
MLYRIRDSIKYYIQHTDLLLMVLAMVICLFGLVLIWSGSQPQSFKVNPDRVMMVQCIGIGVGFVGLIILSLMDFDRFPWLWIIMAVFNVLFQLSLAIPGVGKNVGGNTSWIELPGGLNVQPGEVGKVIFIYTMASHMNLLREKKNNFWTLVQLVGHMGITMAAVFLISKDLGVALMYPLIFLVMLLAYGVSMWWFAAAAVGAGACAPILWKLMSLGQKMRILVVVAPEYAEQLDAEEAARRAYQAKHTQTAVSNGQLLGNGYLEGARTQAGWVPESHTDSIFTTCAEELGFIGAVFLLALLMLLVIRIYYDGWRATDQFSYLVCMGVGGMFMWQIGINVGMNLGVFPVIGLTLPLVSYGGTSMMITLASLGLVCGAVGRIKPNWIRSNDD